MAKKATINDIASNLGLSRNTVSRVLNGSEGISNETRLRVMEEAARVNYKMLGTQLGAIQEQREIHVMLVTKDIELLSGSMFNLLVFVLQPLVRARNATLAMQFMSDAEIEQGKLPARLEDADALIVFEILNERYIQLLLDSGKACVLFDITPDPSVFRGSFDIVIEDEAAIPPLIRGLVAQGVSRFGFVGDPRHCYGYRRRYNAFRNTLSDSVAPPHDVYDLMEPEWPGMHFRREFANRLRGKPLPEAFICANDYLAERVTEALEDLGVSPQDRPMVYGLGMRSFYNHGRDKNSEDYRQMEDLTSAMVMLLFDRLQNPRCGRRMVEIQASLHLTDWKDR